MPEEFKTQGGKPAFFFDRDGVINEPPNSDKRYLRCWDDFRFKDGMIEALAKIKRSGFLTVLITNQQGVAKGLMSMESLESIHRAMQETLSEKGAGFDAIRAATGFKGEDARRKPSPAMLLEAARELGIDLDRSWMVGDHDNDMRAGQAAGVKTIRFLGEKAVNVSSDHQVSDGKSLLRLLEGILHRGR